MPLNEYYGGHGEDVMARMIREYGKKKGKSVFYATANKRAKKKRRRFPEDHPFSNVLPDYTRVPRNTY